VDAGHNVYIADTANCTIRKVTPEGLVTTFAGSSGKNGFADGTGADANFSDPLGVAVDSAGDVFVADSNNNLIRRITPGGVVSTYAGLQGQEGHVDGPAASAEFNYPAALAVDAGGNVYVAESGAIRKISPTGSVTTLAGSATNNGNSPEGSESQTQLFDPSGIAVDASGNVYVADKGNSVVRMITPTGLVTTLAGAAGNNGAADGNGVSARFNQPTGVAVDKAGYVCVSDWGNSTIRRISPQGDVTTLAGLPGIVGNVDGIGPAALIQRPSGIVVDSTGGIYVVDSATETLSVAYPVTQIPATVTLGNLEQGPTPQVPTVTTIPAGLKTILTYTVAAGNSSYTEYYDPGVGRATVLATIVDPYYTGSATAVLDNGPLPSDLPAFTVRHSIAGGSFLWGITSGPAGLVAVGTGGQVLTSKDGTLWTPRSAGTARWLTAVAYGGGQYIAVGDLGTVLLSSDSVTWKSVAQTATTARLNNVIYAAGQYVAVGESGVIITSTDGQTWTARSSGVTGWLRGIAYARELDYSYDIIPGKIPPRFVATGEGGAIIGSSDAITWANDGALDGRGPLVASGDLEALAATNGDDFGTAYIAVGENAAMAAGVGIDLNGSERYLVLDVSSFSTPVVLRGLVQGSGAVFATGENGTILTAATFSSAWSSVPSGTSANLVAAAAIGDTVYVVGEDETILQSSDPNESRLANLSCRTQVGTGANILIAGFVVGGQGTSGQAPFLARASGPALVPFNVPDVLSDPELQLFSTASASNPLATSKGWGGSVSIAQEAAQLGAFAWPDPKSQDSAISTSLASGPYTANVSGASGDAGVALAEVYDATDAISRTIASPRLINLSAPAQVGTGGNILIAGFVIEGTKPKTVLVRASGPALTPFGVSGVLPDPSIQVYSTASSGAPIATNSGWNGDASIATASAWAGAFSWGASATRDAAVLLTLSPGAYTANVSGASGDGGVALVEVYEVQ
jgi:sugar lactone lactonase YvrE